MDSVHILIHDLFLLIINLSQLKDPERIVNLFVDSINSRDVGVQLSWTRELTGQESHAEEIATRESSFGFIIYETGSGALPKDIAPVISNAVSMLAIVLENRRQAVLLETTNERLELQVAERMHELAERNASLQAEMQDRMQAESALRESESRFIQLADNLPAVFWLGTLDWNQIIYLSPAYEEVWGRPCQTLYDDPRSWLELVHPDDVPGVLQTIEGVQTTGELPATFPDYRIIREDGQERWISARAFAVYDDNGDICRIAGLAEDITYRKQMETQLRQAQKMDAVGRLAGGVAHDFNNMLMAILGNTETALHYIGQKDQGASREQVTAALDQIQQAGLKSASLTRQLLTFSRKQVNQPEVIDPNNVIRQMETMLRRLIGEHIEIQLELESDIASTRADRSQLEQVLMNLAINSRDAMPDGGCVTIRTASVATIPHQTGQPEKDNSGPYVLISVRDTGVGMTEEIKSRVFEPFFTTKPLDKGTGLGLATVYGVVQQAGGHITIESAPHQGATFHVYLPSVEQKPERSEDVDKTQSATGGETLLVCEDEPMVRTLTCNALKNQGYTVIEATNGQEAFELVTTVHDHIDLLITDLVMPGLNGRELTRRLKAQRPELKVIFMSGYSSDVLDGEDLVRDDLTYLQKPFKLKELFDCVRGVLDSSLHKAH